MEVVCPACKQVSTSIYLCTSCGQNLPPVRAPPRQPAAPPRHAPTGDQRPVAPQVSRTPLNTGPVTGASTASVLPGAGSQTIDHERMDKAEKVARNRGRLGALAKAVVVLGILGGAGWYATTHYGTLSDLVDPASASWTETDRIPPELQRAMEVQRVGEREVAAYGRAVSDLATQAENRLRALPPAERPALAATYRKKLASLNTIRGSLEPRLVGAVVSSLASCGGASRHLDRWLAGFSATPPVDDGATLAAFRDTISPVASLTAGR